MSTKRENGNEQRVVTDEMVAEVYGDLRRIAKLYFNRQPCGFTLQPTDLVNEAYLHLAEHSHEDWKDSAHFRAIATRKIWQVLVDHHRKRHSQKRGGPGLNRSAATVADGPTDDAGSAAVRRRVPLESVPVEWCDRSVDLLDLADALEALAAESERYSRVVMLHWFGGMKYADVALCLGVSASTVEKNFRHALARMNRWLESEKGDVH